MFMSFYSSNNDYPEEEELGAVEPACSEDTLAEAFEDDCEGGGGG
jgi:hypothetical protein